MPPTCRAVKCRGRVGAPGRYLAGNRGPSVLPPGDLGGGQLRKGTGRSRERRYLLARVIGQGTQSGRAGRRSCVWRARPTLPGRPGWTCVDAWKGWSGWEHRRHGLQQGGRLLPGVSRGPFGGFCCLRLLMEPVHRLLGGLPPLHGQGTGPPAYWAVAVSVRIMVLQRGGQQSGQRSRLASGRASDGIH